MWPCCRGDENPLFPELAGTLCVCQVAVVLILVEKGGGVSLSYGPPAITPAPARRSGGRAPTSWRGYYSLIAVYTEAGTCSGCLHCAMH